jgi:nucleotide-binding universal stress UspA family protein
MMQTILLPLDGSSLAQEAIPYAAGLAKRSGARIVLIRATRAHTILDVDPSDAQLGMISRAERDLEATAAQLREDGVEAEPHVYYDSPLPAILDAARRHHAELIVMSTHGRSGLGRMMYGSVADDVLRHAEVPVLLIPTTIDHAWPTERPLSILVPLDGSDLAEEALGSAEVLAEQLGARLHLLRIVEPPTYPLYGDGYVYVPFDEDAERGAAQQYLEQLAGRLRESGKQVEIEVLVGLPSTVIANVARERQVDVIAMATHGRGGLARLVLGSVATGTLQRTHAPLLLTRPAALDQPLPLHTPDTATTPEATIPLSLTASQIVLVRQAVESMLLSAQREQHLAGPLRVILGRLRDAEQSSASDAREVVGAR